jgi:hypothetical protein
MSMRTFVKKRVRFCHGVPARQQVKREESGIIASSVSNPFTLLPQPRGAGVLHVANRARLNECGIKPAGELREVVP